MRRSKLNDKRRGGRGEVHGGGRERGKKKGKTSECEGLVGVGTQKINKGRGGRGEKDREKDKCWERLKK